MGNFSSRQTDQTSDEDDEFEDNKLYDEQFNFENSHLKLDKDNQARLGGVYSSSSNDSSIDSDDTSSAKENKSSHQHIDNTFERLVKNQPSKSLNSQTSQNLIEDVDEEDDTNIGNLDEGILQKDESVAWEIDVATFNHTRKNDQAKIPKGRKREEQWKKVRDKLAEPYIPPLVIATEDELAQRKVLDQKRWRCMSRPQYSKSCGMSSLVSCWNYLFSTLGNGSLRPITQEEALTVFGFKPPFNDIRFGPFTGNATLMRWFRQLNDNFGVRGRSHYLYKPHGKGHTMGRTSPEAVNMLKDGLKDKNTTYIYHCQNHYFCPIGFEDVPKKAEDAFRACLTDEEVDTWILVGDPSRKHPGIHCFRWEDISADVNCQSPEFINIRKVHLGKQMRNTKKTGGNLHCIMAFEKSLFQIKTGKESDRDQKKGTELERSEKSVGNKGGGGDRRTGKKLAIEDVENLYDSEDLQKTEVGVSHAVPCKVNSVNNIHVQCN
ncbi:basic immunoglobulin-like variable motif-containing protein [Antedon mediterranea]|uniref:basic immunoglobulin-like variable motif-containing protein n=1 Tax=Antedon mediterranea TaxID=105859 RepID=UPI003AF6D412